MPKLFFYDSLSKKKKEFVPIDPKLIRLYTCGPTVYGYAHIGNLRAYIFADILKSLLQFNGFKVNHVMNITDVGHLTSDDDHGDDKIESAAEASGKTAEELAEFFTKAFKEDLVSLNIQDPNTWCKATDYIEEQIGIVKILEGKGFTYLTSDGVYFDTSKSKDYGTLGNIKNQQILEGARVAVNKEKKNPTDFALWKFSPKDKERQMEWESPWGVGFPGWHLECSTMAMDQLGETLDIHTGGTDHLTIHHPNEIAQSEAVTGKTFVNYWMHSAFLMVEGEKMSKSLGNIFRLKDLIEKGFDPLAYRYLILTSHYNTLMNFTWDSLEGADKTLRSLRKHIGSLECKKAREKEIKEEILSIINDNLDTPKLIAFLWTALKGDRDEKEKYTIACFVDEILKLGLFQSGDDYLEEKDIPDEVKKLMHQREDLRKGKKWAEADEIRDRILELGFIIEDSDEGVKLSKSA